MCFNTVREQILLFIIALFGHLEQLFTIDIQYYII